MKVRGYYEIDVDLRECKLSPDDKDDIINQARVLFDHDIQDRCVNSSKMTWEIPDPDIKIGERLCN